MRLHWTAPVGAFVFCGFAFDPFSWLLFFGLILLHELGHALVVKAVGGSPVEIMLTGFGGHCAWRGEVSPIGRAAIAWGGVWAQLLGLGAALIYLQLEGQPRTMWGWAIIAMLTARNTWLIALNLAPIPPLDGAEAWRLPILLGRALRFRLAGGASSPLLPVSTRTLDATDEAFESSDRRDEVKALVASMLDDARKKGDEP